MEQLFESGMFFTGCNYWASHAGTEMWRNWDAEVVEADFARLAASKNRVVRLFPLWRDFQPLRMHHGGSNEEKEMRIGDQPLPFSTNWNTYSGEFFIPLLQSSKYTFTEIPLLCA